MQTEAELLLEYMSYTNRKLTLYILPQTEMDGERRDSSQTIDTTSLSDFVKRVHYVNVNDWLNV